MAVKVETEGNTDSLILWKSLGRDVFTMDVIFLWEGLGAPEKLKTEN